MYLAEVTPRKSLDSERFDHSAAGRLLSVLPSRTPPSKLDLSDWNRFAHERASGAVTGRAVGPRTVERDLKVLMAILNWATAVRVPRGQFLLERNPLRGVKLPKEESPARPMMPEWRYRRLLEVADDVDWRLRTALVVVHETGHRIKAVRRLRWSDVDLDRQTVR